MPSYEGGEFEPPAPVARGVVRGPGGQAGFDVPLLVDTGADISVIPLSVASAVGAEVQPSGVALRFLDGTEARCDVADLTVEFLRYSFRGPFVVVDSEHGVLGRNVLNSLSLTLDGPRQRWMA